VPLWRAARRYDAYSHVDACVFAELGDEATDEYTALGEQLASAAGHIRRSVMAFDELTRNNARAGVAGEQEKARRAIAGILERHAQSVTDLSLHVAGRLDRIDDALLAARATRRRAQRGINVRLLLWRATC
jgi:hypothetical protein